MGSIIKTKASVNFTVIDNEILKNPNISMAAKGLFCYLQSLPEDWSIKISELPAHFSNGRDAVRNAVKELEKTGYLLGVDRRDKKGSFLSRDYILYPKSQLGLNPHTENPYADNPYADNPSLQNKELLNKDNIDTSSSNELDLSAKYDLTLAYLNKKTNRKRRKCAKSFARFKQRLKDGYTGKDFQKAIDNGVLNDHHKDNDYKWLTMEFITRQDKLEYLINLETKPNKIDYNKYLQ